MISNKTITLVSNTCWSIWNFRSNLIKLLVDNNNKVYVVAPVDETASLIEDAGASFIGIKMSQKGINPFSEIKLLSQLYKIYKKIQPDVILHYTIKPNIYGTIAARSLSIPSIAFVTGAGNVFTVKDFKSIIAKALYGFFLKLSTRIVFLNEDDKELFIKKLRLRHSKCTIFPGEGVDTDYFKPVIDSHSNSDNNSIIRFLFSGRLLHEKGISLFIEAASIIKHECKNVKFCVLGFIDTEDKLALSRQELDKNIKEGNIEYWGRVTNVKDYYAAADCIVLPSYYREGIPRVILEACSMEIPVITTNNTGCRDVIIDGVNGFLCKTRNLEDLTDKIKKVIDLSDEERKKMGRQGREIIKKRFSNEIVLDKYRTLLEDLFLYK